LNIGCRKWEAFYFVTVVNSGIQYSVPGVYRPLFDADLFDAFNMWIFHYNMLNLNLRQIGNRAMGGYVEADKSITYFSQIIT